MESTETFFNIDSTIISDYKNEKISYNEKIYLHGYDIAICIVGLCNGAENRNR